MFLGIESFLYKLLFCGEFQSYRSADAFGKSGASFYRSTDRGSRYIIKTIKECEAFCLLKHLPKYYNHLTQEETLLVPCLGLYKITEFPSAHDVYFCVMKNLFTTLDIVDEIFDLKGSTFERTTPLDQRNPGITPLKDKDFGDKVINLPFSSHQLLMKQLSIDTNFLSKMQTMDYSLLVGLYNTETSLNDGIYSSHDKCNYHFGIIDYLIEYDGKKEVEGHLKHMIAFSEEVSSVDPVTYAKRLSEFFNVHFKHHH